MRKTLLSLFVSCTLAASASTLYTPPTAMWGECQGISDNGEYALWTDADNGFSYIWYASDPENPVLMENYILYDATDDGMIVGARIEDGVHYPGYLRDGVWTDLPRSSLALNINDATCVTPDGKYIGGFQYCKPAVEGGAKGYIPTRWELNEVSGEYDMVIYDNLDYGDHQGMYITCISPDGSILAGSWFWGFSAQLDAVIRDGELKCWENLEEREVVWYYKGEPWGTETGYFINGYRDQNTEFTFNDAFYFCDNRGNLYCNRTRVLSITDAEEGTGEIRSEAAVYNYLTDEWTWNEEFSGWSCGLDQKFEFPSDNKIVVDGEEKVLTDYLNINMQGLDISHVSHISMDGKVLGGATRKFNMTIMQFEYTPFMVVLGEPLIDDTSAPQVYCNDQVGFVVLKGKVDFLGNEGVVYDINGRLIGQGACVTMQPGEYVVRVGDSGGKIIVR